MLYKQRHLLALYFGCLRNLQAGDAWPAWSVQDSALVRPRCKVRVVFGVGPRYAAVLARLLAQKTVFLSLSGSLLGSKMGV